MIIFTSISQHKAGTIAFLLHQTYAEILITDQRYWEGETRNWTQFDREVFENPETVGKCVFVTCLNDDAIGFASFDPRQKPELGIIGHNCILPGFRGKGYGKQQIHETLDRMRAIGMRRAVVSTSEHPFFLPAQRMYLACGFQEKLRYRGGPDPRYRVIEFERDL
jgi:RimJ/RimL family protein N-acetyltransferase